MSKERGKIGKVASKKKEKKKKILNAKQPLYPMKGERGGFSWIWGEIGRPLVFLRPDLCQRAIETGYE